LGDFALVSQLGSIESARPRIFREKLEGWLNQPQFSDQRKNEFSDPRGIRQHFQPNFDACAEHERSAPVKNSLGVPEGSEW
jgi:hypothetical protein